MTGERPIRIADGPVAVDGHLRYDANVRIERSGIASEEKREFHIYKSNEEQKGENI